MTAEQAQAYELVQSYWSGYGNYHDRKEQMAYAAAVLYLTAATFMVSGSTFWEKYAPWQFAGLLLLVLVTGGGAFLFVGWQLSRRRWAGDMVAACMNVAARWLGTGFGETDLQAQPLARQGLFWPATGSVQGPKAIADELKGMMDRRTPWWAPRDVTFGLMSVWTLAAIARLFYEWENSAMLSTADYWILSGLALDMFGVAGIASVGWLDRGAHVTSTADLTPAGKWFLYLSWVAVFLGFALQFVGQAGS